MSFWEVLPIIVWSGPFVLILLYALLLHLGDKYDRALIEDSEVAQLEAIPVLTHDPHPWL